MNRLGTCLPSTEQEIVDVLLGHLPHLGDDIVWTCEARSHGRARTDVVVMLGGEVVAIEVKRRDWRRAVFQAVLNRYCADRSFIALWATQVTNDVLQEASRRSLGVLSVAPDALQVVGEAPVSHPNPGMRTRLLVQLDGERRR